MGLYMYASGAQRQVISVLSHIGVSESYTSITRKQRNVEDDSEVIEAGADTADQAPAAISQDFLPPGVSSTLPPDAEASGSKLVSTKQKPRKRRPPPQPWDAGTLRVLSNSMRFTARSVAATGLFGNVYDNINMVFRTAEQTMGRNGKHSPSST